MNESVKKPNIMNFAGGMGKKSHERKYDGHNLEQAVDNKMKITSQSMKNAIKEQPPTSEYDHIQPKLLPKNNSSTMIGKYKQTMTRARQKSRRPNMVIKNGKLLLSKRKI